MPITASPRPSALMSPAARENPNCSFVSGRPLRGSEPYCAKPTRCIPSVTCRLMGPDTPQPKLVRQDEVPSVLPLTSVHRYENGAVALPPADEMAFTPAICDASAL